MLLALAQLSWSSAVLPLLPRARLRPAAGDGRRRLHPRLHHAGRFVARGNQPGDLPSSSRFFAATPEVESTSRRTGLQLGLAAVTEANTGDIAVKLKRDAQPRLRRGHLRGARQDHEQLPTLDVEFVQLLQDMIGDLTSAPEPIAIKLFSQDPALLHAVGAAGRRGDQEAARRGRCARRHREHHQRPRHAVQGRSRRSRRARASRRRKSSSTRSAILQGEPAPTPVVLNDRAYTIRVRFPESTRASVDAIKNTLLVELHRARPARSARWPRSRRSPARPKCAARTCSAMSPSRRGSKASTSAPASPRCSRRSPDLHLPASIRVEYGGAYEEQQKSFHDLLLVLVLAVVLVFTVLLFEFGDFAAPIAVIASALLSTAGVFLALLVTRTTFNLSSFMGLIMVIGIVAKNGILLLDADQRFRRKGCRAEESMIQAGERRLRPIMMTALATVAGMIPLALGWGAGSQMLQPLAIAVIGGILASMVLSLVITPAVHYYLARPATEPARPLRIVRNRLERCVAFQGFVSHHLLQLALRRLLGPVIRNPDRRDANPLVPFGMASTSRVTASEMPSVRYAVP